MRAVLIPLILIATSYNHIHATLITADLVIYSFDRPLQLYALLESTDTYITGIETISVIYRTSTKNYADAYEQVHEQFPIVTFIKQGAQPDQDFKQLTLNAVFNSPTEYILFAVDDIIVKDYIDIPTCIQFLEQTNAYGFYLRLGTHLTHCYTQKRAQPVPPVIQLNNHICAWRFDQGKSDWGYPNTVDMTLYRKADIADDLHQLNYHSPNLFEAIWASKAGRILSRLGLCFEQSKIVNIPLNRVQRDISNHHMNVDEFSPAELLTVFKSGFKIDIEPLYQINNNGAHMEYEPTFIDR